MKQDQQRANNFNMQHSQLQNQSMMQLQKDMHKENLKVLRAASGVRFCDFDGCEKNSVNQCYFYAFCGAGGCSKYFCATHAGAKECIHLTQTQTTGCCCCTKKTLITKTPTPCIECYPKAKAAWCTSCCLRFWCIFLCIFIPAVSIIGSIITNNLKKKESGLAN